MRIATSVILAIVSFGVEADGPPMAQQPASDVAQAAHVANATPITLAKLLAANFISAGIVTPLPAGLEETLASAKMQKDVFPSARTAFGVLAAHTVFGGSTPEVPLGTSADELFEEYSARHAGHWTVSSRSIDAEAAVLRTRAAGVCAGALRSKLRSEQRGDDPLSLIAKAAQDATGAHVPPGWVSSCAAMHEDFRQPWSSRRDSRWITCQATITAHLGKSHQ